MNSKVGIIIEKPKLELIEAFRFGNSLTIQYGYEGNEDSYMEIMLGESEVRALIPASELKHEVPVCFDPYNGNTEYSICHINIWDYVSERAEEVAGAWLEQRERQLLAQVIENSIYTVRKRSLNA
ncbi:hypothetical protein BWD42_04260 [Sphingobacterium sp. CZ-UAM]|uniref:hypothetical protein n=1 Tax=Sphingobacterium sp. CZ-UAM TaxID=1933868 RepID=UPI0009873A38|nr:hypothetical protein [Sphingobacterium sp. CZ-UAM]OOG19168.1 hypothetical protein BWD42_04260 [Sphingobacterium sp. CZ-UAM]